MNKKPAHRRWVLGAILACGTVLAGAARADPYREFFEAIARDDVRGVRLQLLRGVSPNSPDPKHGPAIVYAAQQKAFAVMRVLLESPATDVNVFNQARESALMYAALHGEIDLVRRLVERGAQVNHPGWTPLHYAATTGQIEIIEFLLEMNAYIDAASESGTTPLMLAARGNQTRAARLLVERGADPSLRNDAGLGAPEYLMHAGSTGEAEWMRDRATEYLRKYGTKQAPVPAASDGAAGSGEPRR